MLIGLWARIARICLRGPRAILGAVGAVTLVFAAFLLRLEVDTSFLAFVRPEARAVVETIEDDFGEGAYLTLVFEARGGRSLLEPELLKRQLRIMREIEASHPVTTFSLVEGIDRGLRRVRRQSLFETDDYATIAEAILGLAGGRTVRDLEKVSAHFLSHPEVIAFYRNLRLAQSAGGLTPPGAPDHTWRVPLVRAIKALVRVDPGESREHRRRVLAGIRDRLEALASDDLVVFALSDDLVAHDMDADTRRNAVLLGATVLVIDVLCVWALFRSRRELGIVFAVLAVSCVWTFGLAGLLGVKLSFLHLLAFPILLGTGIDDTLIFGRRMLEEGRPGRPFAETLSASYRGTGNAIFLTTFTTFLAFLATGITARADVFASFFFLVSVSMAVVFLLTVLLEGSLRTLLARRDARHGSSPPVARASPLATVTRRLTDGSEALVRAGPRPTVLVLVLLLALSALSATRLESEMSRDDLLQPGMPSYRANEALQTWFGDFRVGYVLFTGRVEDPDLLLRLARLEERLSDVPELEKVLGRANVDSVLGLAEKLRLRITPETDVRALFDAIRRDDRIADHAVDMTFSEAFDHAVRAADDGDGYDGLLVRFFVQGQAGSRTLAAVAAIEREIRDLGLDRVPGVEVTVGGGEVVYPLESVYYSEVMIQAFLLSAAGNLIVLLLIWRRLAPALLAMAPMLVATALVLGAMPVFGVAINPLTLAIGAIVIGLGIDYPIHILERYAEERRVRGRTPSGASRAALDSMGPHVLAGMLTTSVGFCASCVMLLPMSTSFGLLTGAAIAIVYGVSLFALPALRVATDAAPMPRAGTSRGG